MSVWMFVWRSFGLYEGSSGVCICEDPPVSLDNCLETYPDVLMAVWKFVWRYVWMSEHLF